MAESSHTPDHIDHEDPGALLEKLLMEGKQPPLQLDAPEGRFWTFERLTDGDEPVFVLSLLNKDSTLVCQASTAAREWG